MGVLAARRDPHPASRLGACDPGAGRSARGAVVGSRSRRRLCADKRICRDPLIRRYDCRRAGGARSSSELGARCAARRARSGRGQSLCCIGPQAIGAARDRTCADRAPAAGGAPVSLGRPPPPSAARARGHLFGEAARYRLRPREPAVRLLRRRSLARYKPRGVSARSHLWSSRRDRLS